MENDKNFEEFLENYEFISRLEFIKGFKDCKGSRSKIFVLEGKENNDKKICKRIRSIYFRRNEFNIPMNINTERVLQIENIYKSEDNYYYVVSPFNFEKDVLNHFYEGTVKESDIKPYVLEMAKCIKDCHDNDIIHLDIKAENFIIISHNPVKVRLIDFGFAQKSNHVAAARGTTNYCAPEVYKEKCYKESDIWSFGVCIYYLLKGDYIKTPFDIRGCSSQLRDLLKKMTKKCYTSRITIDDVINHPWFLS